MASQFSAINCPFICSLSRGLLCALSGISIAALPSFSQSISFAQVQQQALHKSYDLASARIENKMSRNKIREAAVPYFPVLTGSVNSEYIGGLGNQNTLQSQQAVVVGNTILPGNTRFQNAISLNANYTALDFGARSNTMKAARHHAISSNLQEKIRERDLRLDVLGAFTQALLTYKELVSKQNEEKLQAQLYEIKSRYWDAGKISRIELGEQAIILKNCEKELAELKQRLSDDLNRLSSFTHDTYNVATARLDDLEETPIKGAFHVMSLNTLPDFKAFDHLIKEKQAEVKALKAQRFPQLVTYGSFVLYGSNQNNWISSIGNLSARQITAGIGLQLPIFDGFKNRVAVEGKKLEIEQLQVQRDKRLWEVRKDFEKSANAVSLYGVELNTKAELVSNSKDQLTMTIRLTESQVQEKAKAITEQIDLIGRQLDEEKTRVQKLAASLKLKIYAETQDI